MNMYIDIYRHTHMHTIYMHIHTYYIDMYI